MFNFRFSADKSFKEKFERLAEVLGVENPLKNMDEVFERAMDISLEKKDPKKKLERRLEKERKRGAVPPKNLVRTRWSQRVALHRAQTTKQRPATFLPKSASVSKPVLGTNASIRRKTARGAAPGRDSESTTNGPMLSIVVTTSATLGCFAVGTIVFRRSVFTGLILSGPRLKTESNRRFPDAASGNPLRQRCTTDTEGSPK